MPDTPAVPETPQRATCALCGRPVPTLTVDWAGFDGEWTITTQAPLTCRDCSTATIKVDQGRVEISVSGGFRVESRGVLRPRPSK
jgi:hypothetical protein